MKSPIIYIDEEEYNIPNNSDCDEPIDLDDEFEEPDCEFCNSTGEGYGDNFRCPYCHGRGTVKRRKR